MMLEQLLPFTAFLQTVFSYDGPLRGARICTYISHLCTFTFALLPAEDSVKGGGVGGTTEILLEM